MHWQQQTWCLSALCSWSFRSVPAAVWNSCKLSVYLCGIAINTSLPHAACILLHVHTLPFASASILLSLCIYLSIRCKSQPMVTSHSARFNVFSLSSTFSHTSTTVWHGLKLLLKSNPCGLKLSRWPCYSKAVENCLCHFFFIFCLWVLKISKY